MDNSEEKDVKITRSLKSTTGLKQSRFQAELQSRQNQAKAVENFEKKADDFMENRQSYAINGAEVAKKFMATFRDKTLISNKGVVSKEMEKEIRESLQHLMVSMNNDPDQEDNMGTIAGVSIIVRALFELRDRINTLEYENAELKEKIKL